MTEKEIFEKIRMIIMNLLSTDGQNIKESTLLVDDLGIDSVAGIELLFEIKENFQIDFPHEDFAKIKKVKDIIEYIKK